MKIETPAEQLLFCTVRIETEQGVGTGFIVSHSWGEKDMAAYLVTNKHVVDGSSRGVIRLHQRIDRADGTVEPALGNCINLTIAENAWAWVGHPDGNVDVAVLGIGTAFAEMERSIGHAFFKHVSTTSFPTREVLEDLDAMEQVVFIGYPSGMYDEANNLPIARQGMTATPPSVDYNGQPVFLIDASVFPGSSGSPVFICNNGSYGMRGGLIVGSRLIFLGVLASVFYRDESGDLEIREVPTQLKPVVTTKQMIDLGVVFKARTVLEAIEHALRLEGSL